MEANSRDESIIKCGLRVKSCEACGVNEVRYSTVAREQHLKTRNSDIMAKETHRGKTIEFYGVLKEVIELQYNSNLRHCRLVVLFRCDWYNQEGMTVDIRDDRHFKSINIKSFWYKSDPFVLATQSRKIFYLQNNDLDNDWRVVQKIEHRGIYDVPEKDGDVHQDNYYFDTEHVVHKGAEYAADDVHQKEKANIIETNLADLVRTM